MLYSPNYENTVVKRAPKIGLQSIKLVALSSNENLLYQYSNFYTKVYNIFHLHTINAFAVLYVYNIVKRESMLRELTTTKNGHIIVNDERLKVQECSETDFHIEIALWSHQWAQVQCWLKLSCSPQCNEQFTYGTRQANQ